MEVDRTGEDHLKVRKMKKKIMRKQLRAQHTLMRHEGIECVSHATQVIDGSDFDGMRKCCLSVFRLCIHFV